VVADTRAAIGPGRTAVAAPAPLRPLNQPRPVMVQADQRGAPLAVTASKVRRAVESVQETWRIDDEWWRANPISRVYWRVLLEDGRTVDIYHDLAKNRWYRQAYTA
jgi:hypothetical protein